MSKEPFPKERTMSVARGDDDRTEAPTERPSSVSGPPRRRLQRREGPGPVSTPRSSTSTQSESESAPSPASGGTATGEVRRPSAEPRRVAALLRLDDLYRLPMPKLFQLAEREGVNEHTGMNRA